MSPPATHRSKEALQSAAQRLVVIDDEDDGLRLRTVDHEVASPIGSAIARGKRASGSAAQVPPISTPAYATPSRKQIVLSLRAALVQIKMLQQQEQEPGALEEQGTLVAMLEE